MNLLTAADLPLRFAAVPDLEDVLTRPSEALVEDLLVTPGDIAVIGASGRLGPLLARLARRAAPDRRVIAVARFTDRARFAALRAHGVEPVACDMLDAACIAALPRVENVVYLAGRRPEPAEHPSLGWAMNAYLPALIARHFRGARIVAFSTTALYPSAAVGEGGSHEATTPAPAGEHAQACLARERMFEHFSIAHETPGRILRVGISVEARHGLLFDIAAKVQAGQPVDVGGGYVNLIWQGDLACFALRSLRHATTPTSPLNVACPEMPDMAWLAARLGERLGRAPVLIGQAAGTARLGDPGRAHALLGYPLVPLARMIDWVADWTLRGMPHFGRPARIDTAA